MCRTAASLWLHICKSVATEIYGVAADAPLHAGIPLAVPSVAPGPYSLQTSASRQLSGLGQAPRRTPGGASPDFGAENVAKKGGGGPAGIFRRVLPRTRAARVQGVCAASAAGHPSPRPPALPFCYSTFKYFLPTVRSERRAKEKSQPQTAPTASSAPAPPTATVWLGLQG